MAAVGTLLSEVDDPLVRSAVTFVYSSLMTNPEIEAFFAEHVHVFDVGSDEHKLEYHDVFRQFESLMESLLSAFAEAQGYDSAPAFVEAVRRASASSERAQNMLRMLLAAYSYEKFFALMKLRAKAAEQHWRSEAKQVGAMHAGGVAAPKRAAARAEAKGGAKGGEEEEETVDCSAVFKAQESDDD